MFKKIYFFMKILSRLQTLKKHTLNDGREYIHTQYKKKTIQNTKASRNVLGVNA